MSSIPLLIFFIKSFKIVVFPAPGAPTINVLKTQLQELSKISGNTYFDAPSTCLAILKFKL